jgi:hypothetical protein
MQFKHPSIEEHSSELSHLVQICKLLFLQIKHLLEGQRLAEELYFTGQSTSSQIGKQ